MLELFSMLKLHSILVFFHLVAVILGVGAATITDLYVLRFGLRRGLSESQLEILQFLSKLVLVGLVLVWATGIVLTGYALSANPTLIGNEKLWSKLVIVALLSANALAIHAVVLPHIEGRGARRLFDDTGLMRHAALVMFGAVSIVSWYSAVALGILREFNYAARVGQLLEIYTLAVLAAALAVFAVTLRFRSPAPVRRESGIDPGVAPGIGAG